MNKIQLRVFCSKIVYKVSLLLPLFVIVKKTEFNKITLGSKVAEWTLVDTGDLKGAHMISAGLGEDGTFEFEFASRFNSRIIILDPTERAIEYFNSKMLLKRYERLNSNFIYSRKAISNYKGVTLFYPPLDSTSVSYSLKKPKHIIDSHNVKQVETTTINEIIEKYRLTSESFKLLKIDIEGSEYDVLSDIVLWKVLPRQILVEFDFLRLSIVKSRFKCIKLNRILSNAGYICVNRSNGFDFLYILK